MEIRGQGLPIIVREMHEFGTRAELVNSTDGGFVRLALWR